MEKTEESKEREIAGVILTGLRASFLKLIDRLDVRGDRAYDWRRERREGEKEREERRKRERRDRGRTDEGRKGRLYEEGTPSRASAARESVLLRVSK